VGSSGIAAERFAVVTANALTRPLLICGAAVIMVAKIICSCPLMRSIIAGAPPLYGT